MTRSCDITINVLRENGSAEPDRNSKQVIWARLKWTCITNGIRKMAARLVATVNSSDSAKFPFARRVRMTPLDKVVGIMKNIDRPEG